MTDGPALAQAQFDRAASRRGDEDWLAAAWQDARIVVISARSSAPVADGRIVFRGAHDAPDGPRRFLGLARGVPYFTVTAVELDGWQTLREFGARADDLEASLIASAIALEQWHQRHGFCPRCGASTVESQAGWTRTCTREGSVHFPRTDPAVIMLIVDGGEHGGADGGVDGGEGGGVDGGEGGGVEGGAGGERALLGRGPQWAPGRFSTLAGFVEPGESLESAVAREVFEEVGVEIRDVRYVASQPWPFPASLMIGFTARLAGGSSITLDPVEMAEASWFTRDEVRAAADWTDAETQPDTPVDSGGRLSAIPPRFSISRFLIDRWLAGEA
ncbi:NAD(+) diphosphatase [uncultured Jatrophihabitans sp.]|uniref:NAD(+) diphosphatase n=1 Tax=uncultured Jatrophihabitans sp. TaxID=1610747 RepID=UPI0035CA4AA1